MASFIIDGLQDHPSSSKAIKDVAGRCRRMPECEQLTRHTLRRLQLLHDDVANAADDKLRAKYGDVVTRFVNLLRRKALLLRLASSETLVLTIRGLQDKITDVAQLVGRADDPELNEWQESWDEDRALQLVKLQALVTGASDRMLVNEFRGDKKVREALMALNSGISWKGQSPEMVEFKKTTFERVSRYLNKEGLGMFDWFIPIDDVEYEAEAIGSGTFGNVCRGTWLHDGERTEVAVKLLFPETSSESDDAFLRQLQLWGKLPESKFILKLHGGSHVSTPQFYVCENAPNGNIAYFLEDTAHRVVFWRLFKQVAEGIKFLHENKTIHGGLKCNNILVGADYTPKLADFGFSSVRTLSAGMSKGADTASKTSVRWKAKEVLIESGREAPRYESDIYSLAMCMIEAKGHEAPFGMLDDDEAMTDIMKGAVHPRPDGEGVEMSDDEWAFISRLSNPDYTQRPSIDQVLKEMEVFVDAEETKLSMGDFVEAEEKRHPMARSA